MNTLLSTSDQAVEHLATLLPSAPSEGLKRLVADVSAAGLPLSFDTLAGSATGMVQLRRDGIAVSLADGPVTEGAVAQLLASALLEIQGWPVIFAAEVSDNWIGRIQATLATLLDNAAGVAVMQRYGIDYAAHEGGRLDTQAAGIADLHKMSGHLASMELTAEQEIEYGVGLALTVLERFWRTGQVPAEYMNALELIPGARALFLSLSEFAPQQVPTTGWESRRLMANIVERIDDYMEIKGSVRPLMVLTHFMPAIHPEDAEQAVGNVARLVMVPLNSEVPGEHAVLILPHRDGLPFGFRQALADEAAITDFGDRLAHPRYQEFCQNLVPESFCFWQPS